MHTRVKIELKKSFLLIFPFILQWPLFLPAQDFEQKQIEFSPESTINIYGDAGIADFTCKFNLIYLQPPGDVFYDSKDSKIIFKNSGLVLKNKGFDCGNRSRNKDFHKMVRTKEYPEMKISLKEVSIEGEMRAGANVDIQIAGKENNYNIAVDIIQKSPLRIKGQFKINVLNFGMEPITKMFGLIKVDEMIDINFDLTILE